MVCCIRSEKIRSAADSKLISLQKDLERTKVNKSSDLKAFWCLAKSYGGSKGVPTNQSIGRYCCSVWALGLFLYVKWTPS